MRFGLLFVLEAFVADEAVELPDDFVLSKAVFCHHQMAEKITVRRTGLITCSAFLGNLWKLDFFLNVCC